MLFNKRMIPKIAILTLSITALILSRLSPAAAATVSSSSRYTDIQNHWAQSQITRLATLGWLGLFRGRELYPDRTVNKLEALAFTMKATGFTPDPGNSAAAKKRTAKPQTTDNYINIPAWGRLYLELAVEKGFVPDPAKEAFDPGKPVTRLELARILARTLYLAPPLNAPSLTADNKNPAPGTGFTDDNMVPADDRLLLQAVVSAGIMTGYPDGGFAPHHTVTRAELVSILSRLVDLGWIKDTNGQQFTGRISQIIINRKSRELELVTLSGSKKYKLSKGVSCYKNGTAWPVAQSAGYRAEIILDSDKLVNWINLLEQRSTVEKPEKIRGSIKALMLGNTNYLVINDLLCTDQILPLAWDALIYNKKTTANLESLKPGAFIDVEIFQRRAIKVTLLEVKTISDTVVSIDSGRIILKSAVSKAKSSAKSKPQSNSKPAWFNHWDTARIVDKDGTPKSNVMLDDKIEITYLDPFPEEIDDEIPLQIKITNKNR